MPFTSVERWIEVVIQVDGNLVERHAAGFQFGDFRQHLRRKSCCLRCIGGLSLALRFAQVGFISEVARSYHRCQCYLRTDADHFLETPVICSPIQAIYTTGVHVKLLDEIVDLLMQEDGSLNEALLKTKVLLRTIGQGDLVGWVNDELTGYADRDRVPPYRRLSAQVLGNVHNGWQTVKMRQIVPLGNSPKFRQQWEVLQMTQGLGVLERVLNDDDGDHYLSAEMPPELLPRLSELLSSGFHFEKVWAQVEIAQVRQLLIEVRSRLLDFILDLRDEIGSSTSDQEAKSAAAKIDVGSMFAGAVIGDNATFQIMGHQNQQRVSNTNLKGDSAALIAELRKHNMADGDIAALEDAIRADPAELDSAGQFGPKVKDWMKAMMTKVVDASWSIELGVAGGLLTSALQKYYRLP